jgi:hypothetical protein
MKDMTDLLKQLAPVERKKPLLPDLTPYAEVAWDEVLSSSRDLPSR